MSAPRLVQLGRGADARPDPPVRGERLLAGAERGLLRVDRLLHRVLPESLDPLAQTGAIANTTLLVAIASGVLLLFWYSPSVHGAWPSLEDLAGAPLTAQLVRSLHRYSSDACLLFVVLHALQILLARRFTGARWLAWVTGVLLVGLLWFVGWLGYWLVWDQRAQLVAVGTAKLLDGLPIFADPLSRSFLADESVNSMLFFMVFFFHMLVPLAMGVALWLHLTRLNRPRYLTGRAMTLWILGSLVALSLALPATSAPAARMTLLPVELTIDGWYLLPLLLTERLGGGVLWAVVLLAGLGLFTAPRWMSRGRAAIARVDSSKCNSCRRCFEDCPYSAISMVPRTDGRPYAAQAEIDPAKCVGCGICAGSCDSSAIGPPGLSAVEQRRHLESWLEAESGRGGSTCLAFVCASSAGADLRIDAATGVSPELPGYRVLPVPCSGWVHALTIERALKRGAPGVLVVGCGPGEVTYREGAKWTALRLEGRRDPMLRHDHVDPRRVRFLRLDRTRLADLRAEAEAFRTGAPVVRMHLKGRGYSVAAGLGLAALTAAVIGLGAETPRPLPDAVEPELVVSFKHPGHAGESCRTVTDAEKAALPIHMRRDVICERGRAPVRLRLRVDAQPVLERSYAPRGLSADGNSVAIETLPLPPGPHRIELAIGETSDPTEWTFTAERTVELVPGRRQVVLFDRVAGFTWHGDASPH